MPSFFYSVNSQFFKRYLRFVPVAIIILLCAGARGAVTLPISVPRTLVAAADSPPQIRLEWRGSREGIGSVSYEIYRNGTAYASSTSPAYVDVAVLPGTTYSYQVQVLDSA